MEGLEMINAGLWSILPPLIAIVLALVTKEVYSSLTIGLFSGMLIYVFSTGRSFLDAIYLTLKMISEKIGGNAFLIVFLVLLGALVVIITQAGGSRAYGRWAVKKIKTPKGAKFGTMILGVLIFIDDYFNCLTVGTVMRPLTDRHKISRQKLAYIIDATAAPICIIAPISSWAAAVAGDLGENGFDMFVQAIPYNLYALLTIVMVLVICFTKFDFGPMKKAEILAQQGEVDDNVEGQDFDGIKVSEKGKVIDLILPVIILIISCIACMAYVGYRGGETDFIAAIGFDSSAGLALGSFITLVITLILFVPRKLVTFRGFMDGFVAGAKSMIPAILILTLAWSLSGVCRGLIGTGEFVSGVISGSNISLSLLPFLVFIIAALISFSMGTAWGTFGILLPIVIIICGSAGDEGSRVLICSMAATLAGSVFGDHCSPISDTTILSSAGAKCDHLKHVATQIPYALLVAIVCAVGYIIAGFVNNPWIPLVVSIVILLLAVFVINKMQSKKAQ